MYITVKIQEYTNKCTLLQYKVFTFKMLGLDSDMFSLFLVCHPQGGHINIYIKTSTLLCSQELSTNPCAEPTESSSHPHNIFLLNIV